MPAAQDPRGESDTADQTEEAAAATSGADAANATAEPAGKQSTEQSTKQGEEQSEKPGEDAGEDAPRGPFDLADAQDKPGRVDLGALRIPGVQGMSLRMELDRATQRIVAANVTLGQSTLQLQAFAAPRTAGIWEDIRGQIASSITAQGGDVKEVEGPFGPELLALLPVRDAEGKVSRVPTRFLGVDGPRWFLRGILRGAAIVDPGHKALMERYFSEVVVVRGTEARPPSELLTLTMPGQPARPEPLAPQPPGVSDLLERGPEITEVR